MYFKDQQTTERAVEESIKQVSDGGDAAPLTSKVELAEDTVVNVINKHRMGLKKKLRKLVAVTSKKLQKDNVTTDEVVKIVNDNRQMMQEEVKRIPYEKFKLLSMILILPL
ncbi:unnamed protein product [Rhizophagus irregularis]|uniref:Uncharacterized protein n=1 Tax=Rhizophagus irregularis TaxID=588596 RepID=A0A2N1N9P7_9GLOM|nr:hypothetical protein RhiirC2_779475 [Rhizophagus irregularis]CAB4399067.1 unnamed protein product [Rhizophagus irregularis]